MEIFLTCGPLPVLQAMTHVMHSGCSGFKVQSYRTGDAALGKATTKHSREILTPCAWSADFASALAWCTGEPGCGFCGANAPGASPSVLTRGGMLRLPSGGPRGAGPPGRRGPWPPTAPAAGKRGGWRCAPDSGLAACGRACCGLPTGEPDRPWPPLAPPCRVSPPGWPATGLRAPAGAPAARCCSSSEWKSSPALDPDAVRSAALSSASESPPPDSGWDAAPAPAGGPGSLWLRPATAAAACGRPPGGLGWHHSASRSSGFTVGGTDKGCEQVTLDVGQSEELLRD